MSDTEFCVCVCMRACVCFTCSTDGMVSAAVEMSISP